MIQKFTALLVVAVTVLVASGQECDCDGFVKCKTDAQKSKMTGKQQCLENCKTSLDPVLRTALDKCHPVPAEDSLGEVRACVWKTTCGTKSAADGKGKGGKGKGKGGGKRAGKGKGGKGKGGKGKGGKGKGNPFQRFTDALSEAQKASVEKFSTCMQECGNQQPSDGSDSCHTQFQSCSFNKGGSRAEFRQAVQSCRGTSSASKGKGKRREVCDCLAQELSLASTLCQRRGGKGKRVGRVETRRRRQIFASGSAGSYEGYPSHHDATQPPYF